MQRRADSKTTPSGHSALLLEILAEKKRANPRYSLRAFARQLAISPAQLSQIISGKRPVTLRMAEKISEKLSLAPHQRRLLKYGIARFLSDSEESKPDSLLLEEDQFKAISEWYHFAILSLGDVSDNRADPKWIANRLGLDEIVARDAFLRLKRLGLIEVKRGRFKQATAPIATSRDVVSPALRKYHRQNLELAAEKIESVEVALREFSSITMAIDPARIKRAKEMIESFKREVCGELESGVRQEVYTLAIQLFPVSQKGKK